VDLKKISYLDSDSKPNPKLCTLSPD